MTIYYYYDENNKRKVTCHIPGEEKVIYAGNGLFLHIANGTTYYEQCDVKGLEWMHKHGCLNKETEKLMYGNNI